MLTTIPKIVFFDIDDTLYIKHQNCIPDSVAQAFTALQQKGIQIAIATGRGVCLFPPALDTLITAFDINNIVAINGQYNLINGNITDFAISPHDVRLATDCLRQQGISMGYMSKSHIICFDDNAYIRQALGSLHSDYLIENYDDFDKDTPIYQILGFADTHMTPNLPPNFKSVRWHPNAFDVLTGDVSKVQGIRLVLKELGLKFADAMAFGDGLNDVEMIGSVGFGVAMGNAHPNLKAVADFICPRHDDDGIFKGLQMLGVI